MRPKPITEPQILKRSFNNKERECILVEIEGDEYNACDITSKGDNFWGNSKRGAYGAGLGKTDDDKYKPARIGLLGQMAFGKLFNRPVDLIYRQGGDKYDDKIGDHTYDIKCAMRNRGEGLIQHTNEYGKKNKQALSKDIYVFGHMEAEDRDQQKAKVIFVGFAFKKYIEECESKVGYKGNGHLNYVVPFSELKSIVKLLELKKKYSHILELKDL